MKLALSLLVFASLSFGQSTQPKFILGTGGGWDHYGSPRGLFWAGGAQRINDNVYGWGTAVMKGNGASLTGGIAPMVLDQGDVRIFIVPQVGAETTNGQVNMALTVGGAFLYRIGRLFKHPEVCLIGTVALGKSNDTASPTAVKPIFGLGLTWESKP